MGHLAAKVVCGLALVAVIGYAHHPITVGPPPTGAAPAAIQVQAHTVFGDAAEFGCAANIITRESGWRITAQNPSSSAYGLPQALPGDKMAAAGPDWRTNPATQLRWMKTYVDGRYGGACPAWQWWQAHHWY